VKQASPIRQFSALAGWSVGLAVNVLIILSRSRAPWIDSGKSGAKLAGSLAFAQRAPLEGT